MKKYSLVLLILVFSLSSHAQISLAYSSTSGRFSAPNMWQVTDGGYISLTKEKADMKGKYRNAYRNTITLIKYDKDFKKLTEVKALGGSNIFSWFYSDIQKLNNKYWLVYFEPQDKEDLGILKAAEINTSTLELKEPVIVASAAALAREPSKRWYMMTGPDVAIKMSPSGKNAILYVALTEKLFYLSALDENFKPKWSTRESSEDFEETGLTSMAIDDAGVGYLGYIKKKDGAMYNTYSPAGKASVHTIKLDGVEAAQILFLPSKNETIAAGAYKEGDNCSGIYRGKISGNGELSSATKTVFPASLIESLDKEGWSSTKAKKYGITPFFGAQAFNNDDQPALILEFYRLTETPRTTYGHSGSLIYTRLDPATPTFTKIPKYNVGPSINGYRSNRLSDDGLFYYSYPAGNKTVLLYFDHPDNPSRDVALDAKVVNPKNQVLVAALIGPDGKLQRRIVVPTVLTTIATSGKAAVADYINIPISVEGKQLLVGISTSN